MLQGLIHAHSGLRWIVLFLLIWATASAYSSWQSGKPFTESIRKRALFTLIAVHTQLLLGLILYFMSPKVSFQGGVMADSIFRFYTVEHSMLMLVAIVLITMAYSRAKRRDSDAGKLKAIAINFSIALLLILIAIPWPFRGLGAAWF